MAETVQNDSLTFLDEERNSLESEEASRELLYLVSTAHEDEYGSVAERIRHLIKAGVDPNVATKDTGETIFHHVAANWGTDLADLICGKVKNFDVLDLHGRTPLHAATRSNNTDMAQWLLKHGVDIETKTTKECQTPLHYAVRFDAIETLYLLLHAGANLEARDYRRRTPLHLAVDMCRSQAAQHLISLPIPAQIRVRENNGDMAMSSMIKTMPNVAYKALDQLYRVDFNEKKKYFILAYLEPDLCKKVGVKSPFATAVVQKKRKIISHPVMQALMETKWNFVRMYFYMHLVLYIFFLLIWSALFVYPSAQEQHIYTFPRDVYRLVLQLLLLVIFALMITEQAAAITISFKKQWQYRNLCKKKAEEEISTLVLSIEEKQYLKRTLQYPSLIPDHWKESFTIIEQVSNVFMILVIIMHVADILAHNSTLAAWVARVACFANIILWFRLIKYVRAMPSMGTLTSVIFKIRGDVFRYFILATIVYIPYVLCFWVIYGGPQSANNTEIASSTIRDLSTPYHVAVMTFRMSLIDSYPYDDMRILDEGMTFVLIAPLLIILAVVGLNLFIALLSDTFQKVQDDARATSLLQRATVIAGIEEELFCRCVYVPYYNFIRNQGNPLIKSYEDEDIPKQISKTEGILPKYTMKAGEEDLESVFHVATAIQSSGVEEVDAGISGEELKIASPLSESLTKKQSQGFCRRRQKLSHKVREWERKLKSASGSIEQ